MIRQAKAEATTPGYRAAGKGSEEGVFEWGMRGGGAIQTCPFWLESLIPFVASGFSIVLNCFNIFRLEMCISGIMSLGRDFIDHIYR